MELTLRSSVCQGAEGQEKGRRESKPQDRDKFFFF